MMMPVSHRVRLTSSNRSELSSTQMPVSLSHGGARNVGDGETSQNTSRTAPNVHCTKGEVLEGGSFDQWGRSRTDRETDAMAPTGGTDDVNACSIDPEIPDHGLRSTEQIDCDEVRTFDGEVLDDGIAAEHRDPILCISDREIPNQAPTSRRGRIELEPLMVQHTCPTDHDWARFRPFNGQPTLDEDPDATGEETFVQARILSSFDVVTV